MIVAPRIKEPSGWEADTAYSQGDVVKPVTGDDGHYYICSVAGTSHATTEPTWPGAGGSVTDSGTLVWREFCDASGIIDAHTPTRVYSGDESAAKAGAGSVAHRMAAAAFGQFPDSEVYLNLVDDDGAGVKATCTITIAGTAVGSGTAEIRIGNEKVTVGISDGGTASEIAIAIDAAIAALHDLPATPSISIAGTVITLQAKNAGVPGNEIGKYDSGTTSWKPVVTIVNTTGITSTVTGWTGGATNADITDALDAATTGGFALVSMPYRDDDNIDALDAYLTEVSDATNCNGARGFTAITSTVAGAATVAGQNSKRQHIALKRGCRYTSFEIAAAFAAMHAQIGHAALPLNRMEVVNCDTSDIADILESPELESLLWAGVSPLNDAPDGAVRCVRSITMYTKNAYGSPDPLYLDTTTIANIDYARKAVRAADESAFAQCVLRENHVDGEPSFVVTPEDVNSLRFNTMKALEENGNVQQVDYYKARFKSVRSSTVQGRVDSEIPIEVVQGAHIFANYFRIVTSIGQ
jgi:phage tail sheath gpL-like